VKLRGRLAAILPGCAAVFLTLVLSGCVRTGPPVYKDRAAPVDARVKDLLGRMTPEEKFWQLFMLPDDLDKEPDRYKSGVFGFQTARRSGPEEAAAKINAIQKYFIERTRLGIPIIPFEEALHGLVAEGATVFPQSIGLAATFDTELMGRVAAAAARETRSRGIRQVLSPVVNIASDVRWGRTEETYGEDPFLSSEMGAAFVSAFETAGVIATPKHFVANVGEGGRDSYPIEVNERRLREVLLPPFERAIRRAGARSIMPAYNSLDGTPCSANPRLLTRLLKNEWGFKGFSISDACAVGGANSLHGTSPGYEESGALAVTAGLDVIFQTEYDHHKLFIAPFLDGRIAKARIDDAVARVLRAKFELGLFDDPYVDPAAAGRVTGSAEHRALAREAARKSIVLLKNEGGILPLGKNTARLVVVGADAIEARLGGYSGPGTRKTNILDGIRAALGPTANIVFFNGPGRKSENAGPRAPSNLAAAARAAGGANAIVFVAGIEEGEFRDRARLGLPGRQTEWIRRLAASGKPVIVVLVGGSAISMGDWLDRVPAVLDVWYPGEEGGRAVADVLFGDANPGGRLPITFPREEGQLPLVYNHKPTGRGDDYVDLTGKPLFAFGYGLSYTTFAYDGLVFDPPSISPGEKTNVRFRVRNTGSRDGDEVVQLYLRDVLASVARPVREIKAFRRVSLRIGEEKEIEFVLGPAELEMLDANLRRVVEPGEFKVMIGASSADIRLSGSLLVRPR
jgi:beta-glucosidase